MADIARLALQIDSSGVRQAKQALDSLRTGSGRAEKAADELTGATSRNSATAKAAAKSQRTLTSSVLAHAEASRRASAASGAYSASLKSATTATTRTSGATGNMGAQLQQAGFQIGDFAVQVGAGQNVLVAFSQQASQLAGIFGPGGALIGAVIAVGAAIAGPFVRSLESGKEKLDEIDTSVDSLVNNLDRLSESQAVAAQLGLTERRQQINEKISEELAKQQKIQQAIRDEAAKPVDGGFFSDDRDLVAISNLNKELLKSRGVLGTYRQELDGVNQDLAKVRERLRETRDIGPAQIVDLEKIREQRQQINEIAMAAERQAATLDNTARQNALYELSTIKAAGANRGAVEAARARINAAFDEIEAFDALEQAKERQLKQERALSQLKAELDPVEASRQRYQGQLEQIDSFNIAATEKERLREQAFAQHQKRMAASAQQGGSLLTSTQQNTLSATGQFFGNLAQMAQQGGRKQFQAYQNLASAQAAIAAALAVATTLGDATLPAYVRIPLAVSIGAMAAAQIAQIQNQEYQGQRAMGGAVQGGRSYLVGERGPEVVTMGQSGHVTPNHKLGGEKNVTVNLNEDASKAGQVEQRQKDGRSEIDVFVADIRGNGPRARAIQATFGLRRAGT